MRGDTRRRVLGAGKAMLLIALISAALAAMLSGRLGWSNRRQVQLVDQVADEYAR